MTADTRVAAVVVTRNRLSDLRVCLEAIEGQTTPPQRVVVVDNASSDGTQEFLMAQERLTVLRSEENLGGAGGFAWGLDAALQGDVDWVWLMDDDAVPARDCLERLVFTGACSQDGVGAVVPAVHYRGWLAVCGFLRIPVEAGGDQRLLLDDVGQLVVVPIDWAPFLGLLLSARAARQAGGIRGDLFIWGDDCEYCLRLRTLGWRLLCVPGAAIAHPSGRPAITRQLLGRSFSVGDRPPWKEYYGVRNQLLVGAWYEKTCMSDGKNWIRRLLAVAKSGVLVAVVDRQNGMRRLYWQARGIADALRGRTGVGPVP